jgi:hypothetical protein
MSINCLLALQQITHLSIELLWLLFSNHLWNRLFISSSSEFSGPKSPLEQPSHRTHCGQQTNLELWHLAYSQSCLPCQYGETMYWTPGGHNWKDQCKWPRGGVNRPAQQTQPISAKFCPDSGTSGFFHGTSGKMHLGVFCWSFRETLPFSICCG